MDVHVFTQPIKEGLEIITSEARKFQRRGIGLQSPGIITLAAKLKHAPPGLTDQDPEASGDIIQPIGA